MKRHARLLLATILFAAALTFSTTARAIECAPQKCTIRSDGCTWCCPLSYATESPPRCVYANTSPPCQRMSSAGCRPTFEE